MFREGDEVAYKNNIGVKMVVKEIVLRTISVPVREKTDGTGFEKEDKRVLDGIVCFWMTGSTMNEFKFRSDLLVPWDVAIQGIAKVAEYIDMVKSERKRDGKEEE
jgi:hypothetical protein